jgi:SAM-dependent methyltransferase
MSVDARQRFLSLVQHSLEHGTLTKLTLGKYRGSDPSVRNVFIRLVALKSGPHLSFLWRHATRDVTKNLLHHDGLREIDHLLGRDFLDAHLFTVSESAQLETQSDGSSRLRIKTNPTAAPAPQPQAHDHAKARLVPADAPWLRALGVTNERGQPREGMADKFRQIQKFAELLSHLLAEAFPPPPPNSDLLSPSSDLRIADMGSGKGYLTFAVASLLTGRAHVTGVEVRPELVNLCNRVARESKLANLTFTAGHIDTFQIGNPNSKIGNHLDVLIALHACDTATDDALAHGIAAGARLLVVSPCCQKELRRQLTAPPVLADALQHGIFQERQAEFVTDALRAQLLEWAGYRTKVFEFISTEHTAKNLMIAAIKSDSPAEPARAQRIQDFMSFYGIHTQRLAQHLHFPPTSTQPGLSFIN